eukprot:357005-Chlamydomonas_euryale.AAC.6
MHAAQLACSILQSRSGQPKLDPSAAQFPLLARMPSHIPVHPCNMHVSGLAQSHNESERPDERAASAAAETHPVVGAKLQRAALGPRCLPCCLTCCWPTCPCGCRCCCVSVPLQPLRQFHACHYPYPVFA